MIVTDPAASLDRLGAPLSQVSCVVIVHPEPETVNRALREFARDRGWPEVVVGLELSEALLSVPPRNRMRHAMEFLRDRIASLAPSPVVLTSIDVLFERSLELDPLALVRQLSRLTPIAVAWPGTADAAGLSYGAPQHGNYRVWSNPPVEIVALPRKTR